MVSARGRFGLSIVMLCTSLAAADPAYHFVFNGHPQDEVVLPCGDGPHPGPGDLVIIAGGKGQARSRASGAW